ncbi:hypothetical protein GQ457_13G023380 [Hibiscus cannabinus]
MSNKEYDVVQNCTTMNLNEAPMLPPSFRGSKSDSKDTIRLLVDKVNMNSQMLLSRSVTILAVEFNYALLELCSGIHEDSPLARIALEGLWVSYRMTSLSETDLYVTIPTFSILDIRSNTKPEMRLMLGSSAEAPKQAYTGNSPCFLNKSNSRRVNSEAGNLDVSISTMFLMDYRWRLSSQSSVFRLQHPRVLVVPDFLIALGEFFVPSLGAITGREDTMDSENDPIRKNSIILADSVYKQNEDVVHLSRSRQLVADTHGIDEYTYDGCGKTIVLSEENEAKESHPAQFCPIVIIGCGKKLRFVNVKIENGSLLRKYTYLSNDSSYSASPEDDVDIILIDNLSSDDDEKIADNQELINDPNTLCLQDGPPVVQSFTFEAQVVSPEFTFLDGTKSCLDDSSYGEKLLRAKMDLNFMYAYKENDTWIRAMVKDLTIETGSGLIILDPLDISGGYTSIKEKTNISLISTDICVHLSLGAISLILNLQNQATATLQVGNAIPLAPCISFDRIWVSPKENGSHNNLTIWRPQAPSNYVILGDCVTSSSIPPSQAVLAVSTTYGRIRKPVGFKLIGFLSHVLGLEEVDGHTDVDSDCSLWMPVSPPGYISMGCVANIGNRPPLNHVVYCLRSDLVTSTTCSECLLNSPPNQHFTSGFSIWRLDNVLGSFYAHSSTAYPSKENSSDLSHLLLWNSVWSYASVEESVPEITAENNQASHQTSNQSASSSGWDILRSISKATNCYTSTPHFERMWWDKGGGLRRPVSIWRPISRPGYAVLGDCITEGLEPPALGIIFKSEDPEISAKPVQFTKVAHITGKGFDDVFFWYPIAPPGYSSLGCVVSRTDEAPSTDFICCPRMDLVSPTSIPEVPISRYLSSKACQCWSIWKVENQACTFLARSDTKMPSTRLAYTISDSVKPKTRENVTSEIKLRFVSLTVLDSLHGMMTPLFDVTIANIKLVTHGRLEAMNAVLISSIAASTFNMQLEAWEPLVEPFDGIFKFETYDTNENSSSILGKRVHIAATNIVNINVSAVNLDTLVETIISWRRQLELDQKATKLNEEAGAYSGNEDMAFSALDEEDLQTVVVENRLGNDLFIKRIEQNSEVVDLLHHGNFASVWVPPARFSDRLNVAEEARKTRYYVAAQVLFAKGLPIVEDGNSHNFFCALRLVIDSQATDQQKLFPQSARTKCVKPLVSDKEYPKKGIAKWNELFIFEVPRKGVAKLEVEVTNLSAKAGKGEVVGALSFPIGHRANMLKKLASSRMLPPRNDTQNIESYSLKKKSNSVEDTHCDVKLFVSKSYFERDTTANFQRDAESRDASDKDIGFWVRLGSESSWESIRSLLPLSVVPKSFQNEFIAMEVVMKNGKKHAIFRGLATVVNDSDVNLDISVRRMSMIQDSESSTRKIVVEEIFENQRYDPISGWGNKWSGLQGSDPGCWSTKDFSCSSKDFSEPPLPKGWEWISTWTIDKSQFVDEEGWAYGADHPNQWPMTSSKSHIKPGHDVVRRRRWIRTRQLTAGKGKSCTESGFTTISPGCSTVLPCGSTSKASDQCLRIRPSVDYSKLPYAWGHIIVVAVASSFASGKDQPFVDQCSLYSKNTLPQGSKMPNFALLLNQLEKKDILLCCCPAVEGRQIWLSVGADASALHTELNQPVYDWNISVNSPLKLENRLSCPAEFTIWEKTKERNYIEREHGIISSRKSAHIYSVDVQRPIYLSFFVQGDWVLEKDPVLILDLSSGDHISSFWMFHQKSKRRLRVSVERDMGGTSAAPKTIRFFVPYWIINDSSLPLAYQVVEIEGSDIADVNSQSPSKAAKSAERKHSGLRRNIQVLEAIQDTSPIASMLSPQDSAGRSGVTLFTSQKDTYVSPRVGIAVALRDSEIYSPGISLHELEKKERVDVKAFSSLGSYYKLSALVNMTSDRTKVIHLQPYMLFVNRVSLSLCLQQCDSQKVEWIHPTDPPKLFGWQISSKVELLKLRVDGYGWSTPFSVSSEGVMRVSLKNDTGSNHLFLKVEVRSGTKSSRYEVIFRPNSSSSPYRIENRSIFSPILFQQVDGTSDSWHFLLPSTAVSFLWEDLGRRHLLEILADGADPSRSNKYNIDEIFDYQPVDMPGPARALRVTILKEEKVHVVKISDWMPENQITKTPSSEHSGNEPPQHQLQSTTECEFHFIVELAELGVSITDHTPEEILYLSVQNVHLAYSSGLGSGLSSCTSPAATQADYLLESTLVPDPSDAGYSTWVSENNTIMVWLINSMVPDIGDNFMLYRTASQIWTAARDTYSNTDNIVELFGVENHIRELRQADLTLGQYFGQLNTCWQQIDLYEVPEWKCPNDAKVYATLKNQKHVFQLLSGLSDDLDVRSRILATKPLTSVREAFSEVRREESRRGVMLPACQPLMTLLF